MFELLCVRRFFTTIFSVLSLAEALHYQRCLIKSNLPIRPVLIKRENDCKNTFVFQ